jgi:multiple sugar transport system substrate-binding protein
MSRRLIGLVPLLFVLVVCGGCVSRSAPVASDVVLMLRATPEQLEVWQKAVDAFKEATEIGVTIQNEPYDRYFTKLQTMIAGGTPPDVVFMESTRFPEFVTKGALENLDPYLKPQSEIKSTDFLPAAWQAYQYQGSSYGLPNDLAILAVAYDINQLDLAALPEPQAGWTWDDYLKMAQELTADRDGDGRTDVWGTTICLCVAERRGVG